MDDPTEDSARQCYYVHCIDGHERRETCYPQGKHESHLKWGEIPRRLRKRGKITWSSALHRQRALKMTERKDASDTRSKAPDDRQRVLSDNPPPGHTRQAVVIAHDPRAGGRISSMATRRVSPGSQRNPPTSKARMAWSNPFTTPSQRYLVVAK